MKPRRRFRHFAESSLGALALCTIPLLPRRCVVTLSWVFGRLAARFSRKLSAVARANLDTAYGSSLSPEAKDRIILHSCRTFALVILDIFWFKAFTKRRTGRWVHFDESFKHCFETSPAIAVAGHMGNWEVMGLGIPLAGHSLACVANPLENPTIDRMLNGFRRKLGTEVIRRTGAVRRIVSILKEGGRVAMVMDQNTLPDEGGQFVDFFGLPVPTSKAASAISLKTGAAIVPIYCLAQDDGSYVAYSMPPLKTAGDGDKELLLTQEIARVLETLIRETPGQWLWMYKRWKFVPPGADETRYPPYAKRWVSSATEATPVERNNKGEQA